MKVFVIFSLVLSSLLIRATMAGSFNVAINYLMNDEAIASGDGCVDYEKQLGTIRDRALRAAGLNLAGNSANWKVSEGDNGNGNSQGGDNGGANANGGGNGNDNGNGNGNGNGNKRNLALRRLMEAPRSLQGRGCTCFGLCLVTGQRYWCDCCVCCGRSRRYLAAKNDLTIEEMEIEAMTVAKAILDREGSRISCLDPSYEVVVRIEEVQD